MLFTVFESVVVVRCASRTLDVPKKTAQSPVVDVLVQTQRCRVQRRVMSLVSCVTQRTNGQMNISCHFRFFPNNRVYVWFFFLLSLQHGLHLHTRLGVGHAWC